MNRAATRLIAVALFLAASACAAEDPDTNDDDFAAQAGTPATNLMAGTMATAGSAGVQPDGAGTTAPVAGTPAAGTMAIAGMGAGAMAGTGAMAGDGAAGNAMAGTGAMAGDGAMAGAAGAAPATGKLPRVTTTDGPGPFDSVEKVMDTPPGGWLIYPTDIGRDGIKHPLFVFGPGGGTTPETYEMRGMHWDRYGSYGFVIYVLPASTGDGADMKAGLDWLIAQNDDMSSPLYQHLDTTRVCAAGHSMGSITTFDFLPDDRVTTSVHISGGHTGGPFGGEGPANLRKNTLFLCGPDQAADTAFPQCERDFEVSTVPTFYTTITGSDHLTSGRLGWEAIIAWMLWHLADHEEWRAEFLEPTGKFQMGIYNSQLKNW